MLIFFENKQIKKLERKLDKLLRTFSNNELYKFMELIGNTRRLFWRSFIMGIGRGIGSAIGFSVLGAIIIYFLKEFVVLNIPIIGEILSDVIKATENQL